MAQLQVVPPASRSMGLAEVLERVLDKGLVIAGDIKINLCGVELLSIQIRLLIASVDKAREMGLTWWWQENPQRQPVLETPQQQPVPSPRRAIRLDTAAHTPWEHYLQFRHFQKKCEEPCP